MVIFLNRSSGACLVGQAMETSQLFDPKTSENEELLLVVYVFCLFF